ncbi:hypothetical protein ANCCEY_09659 [Ancylostoma ceylanicum]|uniref:Uncharacterized protein n=1 Tax=Ancylostoma ceylanicum TaxID=53326 RepID=A0A0D6LJ66_9BILA|nr:hypothetical protein ANCCEY_09659 [Ancylostoma ceylanicum]
MDDEKSAMLELLMETSGATFGINKALDHMKKSDEAHTKNSVQMTKQDVEETLGKKARLKIDVIQRMEKTYNTEQMDSFKKRGFAFMTTRQRRMVYGLASPFHTESMRRRTKGMSAPHLERRLINFIRLQALGNSGYNRRMKIDLISSPTILAHFEGSWTDRLAWSVPLSIPLESMDRKPQKNPTICHSADATTMRIKCVLHEREQCSGTKMKVFLR